MTRLLRIAVVAGLLIVWPLSLPVGAQSQGGCPGINTVRPLGKGTQTVSNTAVGFTTANIATSTRTASIVVGYVATDAIRYWDDGSIPTATVGMPVAVGERFMVCGVEAIKNFLMIRQTNDATVSYTTYGG